MGFDLLITPQILSQALLIFILRVISLALDTIRIIFVIRGKKVLVWIMGFCCVLLYVLALSMVLSNLDNFYNLLCFAVGFATGTVAGIQIDERLAFGYVQLNIVSSTLGTGMVNALREDGFAATEISACGKDGSVSLLKCNVHRRKIQKIEKIIYDTDPTAFVTIQEVLHIHRGFWGVKSSK